MSAYPKPRSGGALTLWQEIRIVCLCGRDVYSLGASEGDVEIVTCQDCGQQWRVTCIVDEIGGFFNVKDIQIDYPVHYVNPSDGQHLNAKVLSIHGAPDERGLIDLEAEVELGDGKRYAVLHDEELKAGNTWHFVEE